MKYYQTDLYPLEIFSLQYGVSLKRMYAYSQLKGSNPNNFRFKLRKKKNHFVKHHFDLEYYMNYRSYVSGRLLFLWNIRLYRGIRHKLLLPARGQRTHTNRKTKRKFKFTV